MLAGYRVFAADAPIWHSGGVALFYQDYASHLQVEVMQQYGPKVLSFHVSYRGRGWFIFGWYIAPDDADTLKRVVAAIVKRPHEYALLVAGYFNRDLASPEGSNRGEDIASSIMTSGLEYMSVHFLMCRKYWAQEGRTWFVCHLGRELWSRTYYILGTDSRMLRNISFLVPQHKSDHFMVLGCLHGTSQLNRASYLGRCWQFPLSPPIQQTQ